MPATYNAADIAEYFLWKAHEEGQELLSNMKLQKLLYYAQGLHLALGFGPLFDDEIQAWTYGPVVADVYHEYKEYGSGGISPTEDFDPDFIDDSTKEFLSCFRP